VSRQTEKSYPLVKYSIQAAYFDGEWTDANQDPTTLAEGKYFCFIEFVFDV
jgi:hypothetical protein